MGSLAFEFIPTGDRSFLQFFFRPQHFKMSAFFAFVNRKSQSPVAIFLGDEPVIHIFQPIQLALETEFRHPLDFFGDGSHSLSQGFSLMLLVHRYVPFIGHFPNQFGFAAPTGRVAVFIFQYFKNPVDSVAVFVGLQIV